MSDAPTIDDPRKPGGGQDRPGVIARPPLIYLTFLAAGLGLDYGWPAPFMADAARYPLGGALAALGVALAVLSFRRFRGAGTNVQTWKPSTALVIEGPFRFSRNPIYVALTLIYCAIGVAADSGWVLVLVVPLLAVMRYGVIAAEERYLEAKFGDAYRHYKGRVGRWL
ncbi:MAG: isoprenylcysteine carboxylmethyltransferase family protein [Rhodospirillales bacterium]|jgi:protein-S-isoprenylcysteine O-methyltransferase Ste14|nr:protein-S-isoprenylcysteine methyltransferase [Rhodospirillaceae bacterium]MAG99032.1 protein-S-isoprenylcysteine methyltransferase [Rhodospirillaceae bacterium]MDP6573334.1 isoprenylcysteine carboxylmethyltransferase family protein [Rhodospirillales bacterium]MDP6773807.1 isoprenylcysteine carboxylmethyltransferase family protein [Rhodospirillales bacterium]